MTAAAPDIVRVRFARTREFGRDHSYAIVNRELGAASAEVRVGDRESQIVTPLLRATIRQRPFRVSIADAAGNELDADDPGRGIAFSGEAVRVWKRLRDDEQIYGFGEKTGHLNKRGRQLGGYSYTMWNSDTFAYESDTDPIYVSIPFYLVLRDGRTHGVFLDNTFRSNFDVGRTSPGLLAFGAEGGDLDYYLIYGPDPKRVIQRYTEMTGRMPLPPRWALGYHQCRYSYYPESRVRFIARNFRERRIPADVIWLDIHYQDGFKPFSWDRERSPTRLPWSPTSGATASTPCRSSTLTRRKRSATRRTTPASPAITSSRIRMAASTLRRSGRRRRRRIPAPASFPTSANPRRANGGAGCTRCSPTSASPASGTT